MGGYHTRGRLAGDSPVLLPASMERVFVYGTLRQGGTNHALLNRAARLGICLSPPRYTMYHLGAYPGVVHGGDSAIRGEVYAVSRGLLQRIDRLEDYPRLYGRELIPTPYGRAWIYLYRGSRHGRRRVPAGDWLSPGPAGV